MDIGKIHAYLLQFYRDRANFNRFWEFYEAWSLRFASRQCVLEYLYVKVCGNFAIGLLLLISYWDLLKLWL